MAVDTDDGQFHVHRLKEGGFGCPIGNAESELRVLAPGGNLLVRLGVHPGGQAQEELALLVLEALQQFQFVEVVDNDLADTLRKGKLQFLPALVVAVKVAVFGGDPCLQGGTEFTFARNVYRQPHRMGDRQDRESAVGLGCVGNGTLGIRRLIGVQVALNAIPEVGLVEDVEGGSEFRRQLHGAVFGQAKTGIRVR